MKVILAGFSKTGTKTLNVALTQLGFKVYDVVDHFWYAGDEWTALMKDTASSEPLRKIYQDVDAVCDLPACFYWDELLKLFPEAKVILMVRDNEDIWERSWQKQLKATENLPIIIWCSYLGLRYVYYMRAMGVAIFSAALSWRWNVPLKISASRAKSIYRKHNAYVLQTAPKEKLLVYNAKEGWAPLCKFLDVEEPDTPFPHKNKRADIWEVWAAQHPAFARMGREMSFFFALLGIGLAFCIYWKFSTILYGAERLSACAGNLLGRFN